MATEDLRAHDWILLPGTLCTGQIFDPVLDALGVPSARRRTIALRHGAVADYVQLLTPLCEGAVVCGFSLGAIVAAHLGDRLGAERIVLFGLNPHADDPAKAEGRRALARDVRASGGTAAMRSRLSDLRGPDPEGTRAALLAMAGAAAPDIDAQTRLALTRPGAMEALSRTPSPVLVLTGSEDTAAPPALGREAAKAAPRGAFRLLPGLGHYALLEDPGLAARAVRDMAG